MPWVACLTIVLLLMVTFASADQNAGIKGWEMGSAYNALYKPNELDKFRATIVDIVEVTPLAGMAPGIGLKVKEDDDDDVILIHLCPSAFIDRKSTGLKIGQRYKFRGSWAEIDDEDIFMASKIKNDINFVLKVRLTSNGKPFWTMSDEELARERTGD